MSLQTRCRSVLSCVLGLLILALAACSPTPTPQPQPPDSSAAPTQAPQAPAAAATTTAAPAEAEKPTAEPASPTAEPAASMLPADAAPPEKQVFRVTGIEGKHFDESVNIYESNGMGSQAWETLVYIGGDGNPRPGAADSWETSSDGLKWTFHLRQNARWSDGQPVTAHDWVFTFQRSLKKETANPYAWFYYSIKNAQAYNAGEITDPDQLGVKALDDYTLEFTTEKPTPYFLLIMGFPSTMPVPKHVVEKEGNAWASNAETAISNGPFKIAEWKKGQSVTLVKNPEYNGPQPAKLEKIEIKFVPQGATPPLLEMFQADEIDWAMIDSTALLPQALANPALEGQLEVFPNFVTYYMFFNTDEPPFNDLKVRQAFSHAIDREAIANSVMQGLDLPAYTHLPPGFPCNQANDPDVRKIQAYDPALAKQLLAEAGYAGGQGFPKLELWIRQGQIAREGEAVQRMLKDNLGVEVTLKDVERSVYMDQLRNKDITLGLVQWYYDYADPSNFMDWWANGSRHTWANDEFKQLVETAAGELDTGKRCELYQQAERILIEDVGAVFIAHPSLGELWDSAIAGVQPNSEGRRVHYPVMYSDVYFKK